MNQGRQKINFKKEPIEPIAEEGKIKFSNEKHLNTIKKSKKANSQNYFFTHICLIVTALATPWILNRSVGLAMLWYVILLPIPPPQLLSTSTQASSWSTQRERLPRGNRGRKNELKTALT